MLQLLILLLLKVHFLAKTTLTSK